MKIASPLENIDLMYNSKPNKNEQKSVRKCAKKGQNWVVFRGQKWPTCKHVFYLFDTRVLW